MNLAKTLSGLKDAKPTKKGTFLSEGQYVLKVKSTLVIQPMSGPEAFILEAEILESSDHENHPPGTERTWYQSFKFKDSAFGELKKFTYAVLGLDITSPTDKKKIEEQVDPQIEPMLQKVIEENKFSGKVIRCEVVDRETKNVNAKTGVVGTFSSYNFSPYVPSKQGTLPGV